MADQKLTALTELSVPTLDDQLYWVDDPAGTPASYKVSATRAFGLANPLYTTGRLTLVTGNALPAADQLAKGTLYYTSITNDGTVTSNAFQIVIFDGTRLRAYSSAEISLALTVTSGSNYDVFIYDNAGTLTLELSAAWTNGTTRADALAAQSGTIVKSGTTTRRWIGTIRASASNQTADSGGGVTTQVGGTRFVWNAYNQMPRWMRVIDTTNSWNYTTDTIRQANAAAGNKVEYVTGSPNTLAVADLRAIVGVNANVTTAAKVGVGVDSTTAFSGLVPQFYFAGAFSFNAALSARASVYPGLGYHYLAWCEKGADTNCTFIGDNGADSSQAGLEAILYG